MTGPSLHLALKQRKEKDHEDPNQVHTFVLVFKGRRRERPRSYRGTYSDAKQEAWRWLADDPAVQRIVSESGEIVAERG